MLTLFATALHVLRMLSELVLLPTLIVSLALIVALTPIVENLTNTTQVLGPP